MRAVRAALGLVHGDVRHLVGVGGAALHAHVLERGARADRDLGDRVDELGRAGLDEQRLDQHESGARLEHHQDARVGGRGGLARHAGAHDVERLRGPRIGGHVDDQGVLEHHRVEGGEVLDAGDVAER